MSKSIRSKDKYAKKSDVFDNLSDDGTAARTRPFSFDEIMLRRKNKKRSGSVEVPWEGSVTVAGKGVETVSGRVESDRHKRSGIVDGGEQHASKESMKVGSRKKEYMTLMKEEKAMKGEYKESNSTQRKSKDIGDDAKAGKRERNVREKRKNDDRPSDDSDNDHGKRHAKDSVIRDIERYADRKRGKSEHVSKTRNQNGDDERTGDRDAGKKHESRKRHDTEISARKESKEELESRHEPSKSKRRRSRSREHDRDKIRRSASPSPRGHKHRSHDVREQEELSSHSLKDKLGRSDSKADKKRISSNGSSNKSRRHETSASRLGGYSPRKRRSEAAIKTPSPTNRSPEKKTAGWDFPPGRTESKFPSSFRSDLQTLHKSGMSNKHELSNVVPLISSTPKPNVGVLSSISSKITATVDSIQLTQATRPKRRLYLENLPSSASEAAVMEWLNDYLLQYSGVNHFQGTKPCISCIVHKEKGQALVEFLTPEDASMALNFDGKSFSGNILKIRRPKDYVEVTTGVSDKPAAAVASVANIVEDCPHKIFIGGISEVISSEMLMEIAGAFGPIKGYHFETNADLSGSCAFLEYVDQSVTLKACAGLNGMKLGGQVLTVIQAYPDASSVENLHERPFYGIPEHARSLLEKPTQVLKLKNMLNPDSLSSLSEPELEEILEDIRLECARFGMVKSINVVKNTMSTHSEKGSFPKDVYSMVDKESDDKYHVRGSMALDSVAGTSDPSGSVKESLEEVREPVDGNRSCDDKQDKSELTGSSREPEEVNGAAESNIITSGELEEKLVKDEISDPMVDNVVEQKLEDSSNQISTGIHELELNDNNTENFQTVDVEMENDSLVKVESKLEEGSMKVEMVSPELQNGEAAETSNMSEGENLEEVSDLKQVFEPGCVLVEYIRAEASSMAAHCLHGRLFDGRIVSVGYVAHDIYRARFPK